ncbi:MAG: hypothetical protein AMS24_01830 [Chlamydiae bacterium SM23_39]|nr:MAG: hypothetical protein AMS24_01830 [Chlamydiae bacterium SM23_39]
MFKRTFLILIIILTSCQKKHINSLKINIVNEITCLDPRKVRDLNSISVMKMLFEGLTRFSKEGNIELALAKDVKISKDLKKYIFHLKKSYWTDGQKLTSYDFAYSLKKALSPSFSSTMRYKLFIIKNAKKAFEKKVELEKIGIATPDPYTLIIELERPSPYFLELLTMPIFFPIAKHIDEKNKEWIENESIYVGNGPFKIKKWKHQNKLILVKNEKYWDNKKVKLKKIILFMVSQETELNMFEAGQLDWAGSPFSNLPLGALENLFKSKIFYKKPFLGTSFLRINVDWVKKFFPIKETQIIFRKILSNTINRESISKHILLNSQPPANSFLPPFTGILYHEKKIDKFLKIPKNMNIEIIYVHSDRNHLIAQEIQRAWEDNLKIKIILKPLESKIFFNKLYSSSYQIALGSWIADYNDPLNFLEVFKFKDNGTNNTCWENIKYINFLNLADQCIDLEKRKKFIIKAQEILLEEKPIIPLYYLNMCFLKRKNVKDVIISQLGYADFRWAYLEN